MSSTENRSNALDLAVRWLSGPGRSPTTASIQAAATAFADYLDGGDAEQRAKYLDHSITMHGSQTTFPKQIVAGAENMEAFVNEKPEDEGEPEPPGASA